MKEVIIINYLEKKRMVMMRAAAANQGFLKYASGYPLTLTKTLAKPPESVTVYGAEGGVGDKTANLFNKSISYANPVSSLSRSKSVYLAPGTYSLHIGSLSNALEWRLCFKLWDDDSAVTTSNIKVDYGSDNTSFYTNNNVYIMSSNTSQTQYTMRFTLRASRYIAFSLFYGNTTSASRANDVMINSGSTALPYEPYGYKIPVLLSDGNDNKTINLYSDAPILLGDDLRVYPKEKKAYRGTTDISSLQDWTQEWKIPKAEELTVSAGTTILPSYMDIGYYSKTKNWDVPYWGVSFTGSGTTGTRTGNAMGMTATISTDTVEGSSDFDNVPAFQQIRVNGYFNADGSFTETAVEGMNVFAKKFAVDGTNGDVWVRFKKSYYRKVISGSDDIREVTHIYNKDSGFKVHPLFYNTNTGEETNYAYIAAYKMGWGSDGKVASISGVPQCQSTYANRNANITYKGLSYNTQITYTRAKDSTNKQYSGMTSVELDFLTTLFMIEFNTRNCQSIMQGYTACGSTNGYCQASVAETGVEHITVATNNVSKFAVGMIVSLGTFTDRNTTAAHSIVNRKKITSIDSSTGIITIDNDGTTFDTTTNTYIIAMPSWTGATDSILGHTGTPVNNGKYPMKYRGVEDLYGDTWTILADLVMAGSTRIPYICKNPTLYVSGMTTGTPSGNYISLKYTLPLANNYATALNYNSNYPYVNLTKTARGDSNTTYYADYFYTTSNSNIREVLYGGSLGSGLHAGLFSFYVSYAVSPAIWYVAARLSGNGWRG